jgi:LysM repeat protein
MLKKTTIIIAIAFAVALFFSACERSAAPVTLATPTANTSDLTSEPTSITLLENWGTPTAAAIQTAVALGTFTAVPDTATPQLEITPTPQVSDSTSLVPGTGVPVETPVPGATLAVVVPTATPGRPTTYTLQSGEFPYCIARRFNLNPDDLLSVNGLSQGQILQPGLVLTIPQTGSFPGNRALNAHPAQYTVNVDDTFYSIACHFGDVDPASIAAANGLALTTPLTTGQILNIP